MQFRWTRTPALVASLAVALIATSACGKYSISSIRSLKAFKDGLVTYQKGDYKAAATQFEEAIGYNPEFGFSYFYLANSFDNQYRSSRKGEAENDALLPVAERNYRLAIEKLGTGELAADPQAVQFRKRSFEFLIALYGSDKLDDFGKAEPVAKELIQFEPNEPGNYQLLARLYEDQGMTEQAEAMLQQAIQVKPSDPVGYQLLGGFYNKHAQFDKTMENFLKRAELEPNNPEAWHIMGTYYYEKVYRDTSVPREQAIQYLISGVEAEDKALAINPDYVEAVNFKELLVRLRANKERDRAVINKLIAEADALAKQADEIRARQGATS
jgi:tetratricopeptide (TPR) repeat protein